MIGSFWNLCRACPSMPVDKLHSEYRSTYRWHEFTGNSRPEVVRRAPAPNPNQFVGPTNEPPLPRRKKCPELAYKSHEFIIGSEYTDARNNVAANRAPRSEERGATPSRRSKSEGPPAVPNGRAYPIPTEAVDGVAPKQAGESNGLFKKTFTKLSTEYRFQFVWPNVRKSIRGPRPNEATDAVDHPKKSHSMGAIKAQQQQQQQLLQQQQQLHHHHHHHHHHQQQEQQQTMMPTVHKKRTTNRKEATLHELEPLVSDAEERKPHEKQVTIVEKRPAQAPRPFSQTFDLERNNHFLTKKENFGFDEQRAKYEMDNKHQAALANGTAPPHSQPDLDLWFKEVVELRKKAGEYKHRGWGIEIDPELYKKQKDLWDQVSKRSSLSALSLASTIPRPITKEEKEQENNKKSIPVRTPSSQRPRLPGHVLLVDNRGDEMTALPARFSSIRHHLERTTGPDVEEGALLPSPTREKLMPAITKRESESQRGSPKKTAAASRHGSPQKGSPQKGSPKKTLKSRSHSVGPGYVENESPKRQTRSASTAPSARPVATGKKTPTSAHAPPAPAAAATGPTSASTTVAGGTGTGSGSGTGTGTGVGGERKPRPSTLTTSFHSRSKSSSLPPTGRAHASVPDPNQSQSSSNQTNDPIHHTHKASPQPQPPPPPHALHMRKKDKDKENASAAGGRAVGRPRPKSTIATTSAHHPAAAATAKAAAATTTTAAGDSNKANGVVAIGEQISAIKHLAVPGQDKKLVENDGEDGRDTAISISSCSPQPVPEVPDEPIVKSPPEPTRVKSPEQIIMRSPDPVNWTVPLDTGKTFTVTQNVKEGETYSRPQSEIKASTPVEKPPPPPQSAPPELTEQVKMDAWKNADLTDPKSSATTSPTSGVGKLYPTAITPQPLTSAYGRYEAKPLPGSTLRCLDDPSLLFDPAGSSSSASASTSTTTTSTAHRNTATDVLEKARDRFDRFWGGNKEDNV